ncbi:MAG: T9SS type A sorting domain-containing protein [Bacteroidetes bacterium]|nr:T9SS type A sorting domain-containing protein [Bacteroidota bacterium]
MFIKRLQNPFLVLFITIFTLLPKKSFTQDLKPKDWRNLTGYWKFQNAKNLTKATFGNDLMLIGTHSWVKGPSYDDTAIRIGIGSYYKCKHNIAPNGGGDSVNRYTMMYDFKILSLNKWHTFFQTDTTNSNDGECFIRPNTGTNPGRIGTAATSYTNDSVFPNKWYRLVISVNNGNFYRYYLNGKLILEGDTQDIDDRFALTPKVLFFADNNQEDDTIDIASIAIFDTCLSTNDISKIGTIEPCIAKPPIVDIGNDTFLCQNDEINLNAGNNFVKYQWSNGSSLPFVSFSGNSLGLGKKYVWVKIVDKNGCSASDTIMLNVIASPKNDIGKDTSLCEGNKIKLNGGTDTSYKYVWKNIFSNKIISTASSIIIDTTGKYWLQVKSKDGCIAEDSIIVSYYKNPPKPEIKIMGNKSFCTGDSVKLIAPTGYSIYSWSNGKNGNPIFINSNNFISLQVTDNNKCTSLWSDTLKITVFQNPSPPIIEIKPDTVFCSGDSVTLSVNNVFKEYKWNNGTSNNSIVVKQSGWYNLMVIDSNGCKSNYSKNVNIYELPTPEKQKINILGNTEFCSGDSVVLSTKEGFSGYVWNDSFSKIKRTIYKTGNFKVKVQNADGCFSNWSDEIEIIVNPTPLKPTIKIEKNDTLMSSIIAEDYFWFLNSIDISNNDFKIYAPQSGYYKLKIADKNCFSSFSDSVYYKKLNIIKSQNKESTLLFPNPANGLISVYLKNKSASNNINIEIYDITGVKICCKNELNANDNCLKINTTDLKNGMYYLKIYFENFTETIKFEKN